LEEVKVAESANTVKMLNAQTELISVLTAARLVDCLVDENFV